MCDGDGGLCDGMEGCDGGLCDGDGGCVMEWRVV